METPKRNVETVTALIWSRRGTEENQNLETASLEAGIYQYKLTHISNHPKVVEFINGLQMSHVMRKPVLPYANNKGADQHAHPRSLISAFVIRCLDSIMSLVSISEIASL